MRPLRYARATDVDGAVATVAADPDSAFLAGGTTEVDLIRLGVARPRTLVDINALPLADVDDLRRRPADRRAGPDERRRPGSQGRRRATRRSPQALLLGASEQLRNMASIGGNLCQRTRCPYFRDDVSPCNKREPGSGCSALDGISRGHAILGTSEHCIATHPSDLAVPLVAFDAVVHTVGPAATRTIPIGDFYLPPGTRRSCEHPLAHGELIVAVELPPLPLAQRSLYLKYRDRQSYEFALVSVAAAVAVEDGVVAAARLALGGVGTVPWRARLAERASGRRAGHSGAVRRGRRGGAGAPPRRDRTTRSRSQLAQRAIVRGLTRAVEGGRS